MEYCSACKSILKPEYTFCPFCGAKIPGKPEAEDTGEILLLAKPEPGDVVVYKSWETIEDDLGALRRTEKQLPTFKSTSGM